MKNMDTPMDPKSVNTGLAGKLAKKYHTKRQSVTVIDCVLMGTHVIMP